MEHANPSRSLHPPSPAPDLPARVAQKWPSERWQCVHVLVGVSGGPDSIALLRALLALRPSGASGKVYAAHVNHQLRGDESDRQQAWLESTTSRLGVQLLVRCGDIVRESAQHGDGWEAAARAVRYRLLVEMASEVGARYVALGHTRDDQIETILFRLLRGTGLRGLSGMPALRPLGENAALVRPLLDVARAEVLAYLSTIGQEYCLDSSNQEVRFTRNRLRRQLLPLLREHFNSEVDEALWRLGDQAAQAQQLIEALATELWNQARPQGRAPGNADAGPSDPTRDGATPVLALRADVLEQAKPYLAVEAWRLAWRAAGWPEQSMAARHWQQLAELSQGEREIVNLPAGRQGRREAAWAVVRVLAPFDELS